MIAGLALPRMVPISTGSVLFRGNSALLWCGFRPSSASRTLPGMAIYSPKHLSKPQKQLFRQIVDDFGLEGDSAALTTLRLACEALDRCEEARLLLAKEGLTVETDLGGTKTHPAVAIERDSRLAAVRCLRELSLDGGAGGYESARPPRIGTGRLD